MLQRMGLERTGLLYGAEPAPPHRSSLPRIAGVALLLGLWAAALATSAVRFDGAFVPPARIAPAAPPPEAPPEPKVPSADESYEPCPV